MWNLWYYWPFFALLLPGSNMCLLTQRQSNANKQLVVSVWTTISNIDYKDRHYKSLNLFFPRPMAYAVGVMSALCTFLLTKLWLFSSINSVNTMFLHVVLQKDAYTHPRLPQITSSYATLKATTFYVLQMPLALLERKFFRGLGYKMSWMSHIYLDFNWKA